MTSEIANLSNNSALAFASDVDAMAAEIAESQAAVQQTLADQPGYASFAKFHQPATMGDVSPWEYGRDDDKHQIREDAEWVVDPGTIEWGWGGFKKDEDGNMIDGQKPDQILVPFTKTPPAKDPALPWASSFTVKFRAMCIQEGGPVLKQGVDVADNYLLEAKGDVVEFTAFQATQEGFREMVNAMRERVLQFTTAKNAGNVKQMNELGAAMYPRVQFHAKLKVKIKNKFTVNKPILKQVGWTAPVLALSDEAPSDETHEENLVDTIEAAQAEVESKPKAASKRSRTR